MNNLIIKIEGEFHDVLSKAKGFFGCLANNTILVKSGKSKAHVTI